MKKKLLYFLLFIVLLVAYFGYKGFNLYYYDVDGTISQDFYDFVEQFHISNTITLQYKEVLDNNYFEYQNMKIRNDFKDFNELDPDTSIGTSLKLVLKDENNNTIKVFWMLSTDTYVNLLKMDKDFIGTDKKITNLTDFLEKNNINNDIELFNYLSKHKFTKSNIFTSVRKMKENYSIQLMISLIIPTTDSVTLINGDYEGYIFNLEDNTKEVTILKNDKRYVFVFMSKTPLTDEYLTDILSTIVID